MFGYAAPPGASARSSPSEPPPPSIIPTPIIAASRPPGPTPAVAPAPAPVLPPAPAAAAFAPPLARPGDAASKRTMIGNPGDGVPKAVPVAKAPAPATAAPAQASGSSPPPAGDAAVPNFKGTMLGVARPGIAPIAASDPPPASRQGASGTMMGVAAPGIAPLHASAGPLPAAGQRARPAPVVLPKPAPLVDDEPALGPAPRIERRGVPMASVAAGVLGLVVVVGLAVAFLWKGQSLVVVPHLDSQGHEQLHLVCDSCKDGTKATLGAATAEFHDKETDLATTTPLIVGDNPLSIHLDRPGWGRDEEVRVVVPIAFRIKADLASLAGAHPSVVVRVQARPATVVQVDGKPVPLDAKGEGAYTLDVSAQATGWADDLRLVDQSIPYSIASPGAAEQKGTLPVRAGIATLHLDSPGPSAVIETSSFRIRGHTLKGGTVTANGQPVPIAQDGSFERSYDAPSLGDISVEVRADGPQLASRTATFTVKRVARLVDEAKAREHAPWLGYDAIMADAAGSVGKDAVVEGDVVKVGQGVALIDDARGCAASDSGGSCIVRVVYGGDDALAQGVHARVFGKVTAMLAAGAGTAAVPVVQADFVVKGRSGRR